MKFRKLVLLALSVFGASMAQAYTVMNQTNHDVFIRDVYGFRGLNTTIPAGGQVTCSEALGGCKGKLWLYIYPAANDFKVLCSWDGKIDDTSKNYFVIREVPGAKFPSNNWCQMVFSHK